MERQNLCTYNSDSDDGNLITNIIIDVNHQTGSLIKQRNRFLERQDAGYDNDHDFGGKWWQGFDKERCTVSTCPPEGRQVIPPSLAAFAYREIILL